MRTDLPYIDAATLNSLVSPTAAIDALRDTFRRSPTHVPRVHLSPGSGEFLIMPAASGDVAGTKLVTIQPANAARGLPIIQGTYLLFDMTTGATVAMFDGAALTTLRTPAASALATDVLARPDAHTIGVLGTGPQAAAHVTAIACVRPAARTVVVAGRTPAHVDAVVAELHAEGYDARSGTFAEAGGCDIVNGCTRADVALITAADVRPGAHLNLVGSYRLDLREVAADVIAASTVYVDELAAAKAEAGDLHLAVEEDAWSWDAVAGDLADLAAGRVSRRDAAEITLFKSVGLAVQDLAVAHAAARLAGLLP
jgi:ornithine cyclodeaminase